MSNDGFDFRKKLNLAALNIDEESFKLGMDLEGKARTFLTEKFIDKGNEVKFGKKFIQAISGNGQELLKMDSINSSSLCSLLFFYNVGEEEGHQLTINGITYTESFFEYKNKVYSGRAPSNMDVVLTNKDDDILFIECKFSEYLKHDKPEISETYFTNDKSSKVMEALLENHILIKDNDKKYAAKHKKGGDDIYATGIKQIVSHYVGINHFIEKEYVSNQGVERNKLQKLKNPKVRFIEVLFDLGEEKELPNYREAVNTLIHIIEVADEKKKKKAKFLPSTTYQDLLAANPSYKLDQKVSEFYRYRR